MYIIISFLLGILFTFAFAPYEYFAVGFISISGFLLILDREKVGRFRIMLYGFLFAFGHHVTGLYWISNSLLVEPEKFAWLIPFAVSIIPAYLAIYTAFVSYFVWRLEYKGLAKVLFFSGLWVFAEIIRGHAFTGFPWNLAGYTLLKSLPISQLASIFGVYGLSLIAIFLFSAPYYVISSLIRTYKQKENFIRFGYSFAFLFPLLLALIWLSLWGESRISQYKNRYEDVNIRIVQPNISQRDKHDRQKRGENLFKYVSLSVGESEGGEQFIPDLIVWPEAAILNDLQREKDFVLSLQDIIPFSSHLALGSVRRTYSNAYNSVQFVKAEGVVSETYYDKFHLVPFGEYLPMRPVLSQLGLEKIAQGMGDFGRGDGPQTIKLNDKIPPFSPLICYEIIFPGAVRSKDDGDYSTSSKWILNVTNDGWFGFSSGPYQHLAQSRMRAIEEGVPVIRAANTGVSAVIDSFGNILGKKELNEDGIIDKKLPAALPFETIFSKYGNKIAVLFAALFVFSATFLKYTYRNKR